MDLFDVFAVFVGRPWLSAIPALAFALAWGASRSRWAASGAIAWTSYGLYEAAMAARVLCTGECNIRVDLLLIAPALVLLSLVAAFKAIVSLTR